jgi:hypothetical protein
MYFFRRGLLFFIGGLLLCLTTSEGTEAFDSGLKVVAELVDHPVVAKAYDIAANSLFSQKLAEAFASLEASQVAATGIVGVYLSTGSLVDVDSTVHAFRAPAAPREFIEEELITMKMKGFVDEAILIENELRYNMSIARVMWPETTDSHKVSVLYLELGPIQSDGSRRIVVMALNKFPRVSHLGLVATATMATAVVAGPVGWAYLTGTTAATALGIVAGKMSIVAASAVATKTIIDIGLVQNSLKTKTHDEDLANNLLATKIDYGK